MSLTSPYKQHHYMGEAAGDAAILIWLQTNLWTHDGTGTGNPIKGMLYFDTNIDKLKVYALGAWEVVISGAGLDAAYIAGQTIDIDIADLAISFSGAYSLTVDLAGITGDADGFFIEDIPHTEYIRATMNNTGAGIDWSANVRSIVFAAREASSIIVNDANLTLSTTTTGDISINSVQVLDIDAVGILSINSSGAAINIGNDNINAGINIGTAGVRTITIGTATLASTEVELNAIRVDINAGASGVQIDSAAGISIDAHATSNFSVNGLGHHMTVECFGGGAQFLSLSSEGTDVAAIKIYAVAPLAAGGGIDIDADTQITMNALTSISLDAGAASNLTLGAHGGSITVNDAADTALDGSFTSASIIGCFNELKNGPIWMSGVVANAAAYIVNEGDEYAIVHVTRTAAGPCSIEFKSAWIAINYNTIKIKDTGRNALVNNITLWTEGGELFENDAAGGLMKSDSACWTIQAYNGNLYVID